MAFTHHLAEVLCSFRFNPEKNPWDSTFFGKYYELIENEYTEKKELQGFQLKFDATINDPKPETSKMEPRMVFTNPNSKNSIVMSSNYISIHKMTPYTGWEVLLNEQIRDKIDKYTSIGLGKSLMQVQMLYLNQYTIEDNTNFNQIFNFLPPSEIIGTQNEGPISFQGQYSLDQTTKIELKLNSVAINNIKQAFFECSTIVSIDKPDYDIFTLAQEAHDKNLDIFKRIVK